MIESGSMDRLDRRGMLRLTALAGVGVSALALPTAAAAASGGGSGAVEGYSVQSVYFSGCDSVSPSLTVSLALDGVTAPDDVRFRFVPSPFTGGGSASAWFAKDFSFDGGVGEFYIFTVTNLGVLFDPDVGDFGEFTALGQAFLDGTYKAEVALFTSSSDFTLLASAQNVGLDAC